ncbi:MAG: BT4734/BF3469 family protein, partial [Lutibacter sp.]
MNDKRPDNILEREVSLYMNAKDTQKPVFITIKQLLHKIKSGAYKEKVNHARRCLTDGKEKYNEFKTSNIPGFTLSAKCKNRAKGDGVGKLIYHTGILQIDIDNPENLPAAREKIIDDIHTLFCYTSISGNGLKVGIIIDGSKHSESFRQAEKYYQENFGITIDKACKDIFRLCFVSYDTELYINPKPALFVCKEPEPEPKNEVSAKLQKPKFNKNGTNTNKYEIIKEQNINGICKHLSAAKPGNRHQTRNMAGYVAGGLVSGGVCTEAEILPKLFEISDSIADNGKTPSSELKTIQDGFEAGKLKPIHKDTVINDYDTWIEVNGYRKAAQEPKKLSIYIEKPYQEKTLNGIIENKERTISYEFEIPKHLETSFEYTDTETGEIKEVILPFCFWSEESKGKEKTSLRINQANFIDTLKAFGFSILSMNGSGTQRQFIHKTDNIIIDIDSGIIRNFLFTQVLEKLPSKISPNYNKQALKEKFASGINTYTELGKLELLPIEKIPFLQDTQDSGYFFFKNGFIEVTKDNIKLKPYTELKGYIWKTQIIEHDIQIINESEETKLKPFDFEQFTMNICSIKEPEKKLDKERWKALVCTIGYLLHNFKTSANKYAVIFTEASVDDEPQGRTGKGLLMRSIGKIRKVTTIDGKNFSFDSQFAFQNVDLDTQILFFDDVKRYFDFQRLFSAITEGLSFERKHKDRINLNAEESPKIVIATNYAIQGNSESDRGRKYEMELLCYYNANFRPV